MDGFIPLDSARLTYKRTHEQMLSGFSATFRPNYLRQRNSPLHPLQTLPPLGIEPFIFPANGMDSTGRGPTHTARTQQTVIDLTSDDSDGPSMNGARDPNNLLLRPQRNVIDVDALVDRPGTAAPDIVITSSRTFPNRRTVISRPLGFIRTGPPHPLSRSGVYNNIRVNDSRANGALSGTASVPPILGRNRSDHLPSINTGGHLARTLTALATDQQLEETPFVQPQLHFDLVAFDLRAAHTNTPPAPPPAPPAHTRYPGPGPARDGFTRSPAEKDTIVCPNCEEELGGCNEGIKGQVWVAKNCGHVYCGECTQNRKAKRTRNSKEKKGKGCPFSTCVVEGCKKSVSAKTAMIQVYL
ncbi:MAG: hypothetical protein M1829_001696 [Trizodia sp. TS-e1964]|nr:MAG: hypothetical protein M1829_001696 [Trizodia sp. TS-e1964]